MKKIQLGGHKGEALIKGYALVDDEDFKTLSNYKWVYQSSGYAFRTQYSEGKRNIIYMHREIMNVSSEEKVDHINGNGLDNRKKNLRAVTHAQNLMNRSKNRNNTSGYKGVGLCRQTGKWRAQIKFNYKSIWLGRHETALQAARAYDEAASELFGVFAVLNFEPSKEVEGMGL